MPLHVESITQADIPRMVDIQQMAMGASAFFRSTGDVPNIDGTPEEVSASPCRANKISRVSENWDKDPTCYFLKAVDDDSGEMVAFAKWHVYHGDEGLTKWRASVRTDEGMEIPIGANEEGFRFCKGKLLERRREFFGEEGRDHCLLALLATDPRYERRGAASLLTQWGCDVADRLGIECYLEASKKGHPVYKRKGFEEISSQEDKSIIHFDASRFTGRGGSDGDWVNLICMVRKYAQ
ncbi:acetyltransferase, GNAT family [Aspergillus nomiae NRRL 13137]|uniref:Acetyltransferase, GNAT family n=1 Tax=Aspergillus nomiae NRRL (strain ATCC 15546 / NRRL 13137 / CBS 260.88 / M93) TaxID=1509407 RepID=A0A0L1JFW4_ASPN3|nr:acetyltransferase, GNAT family [Aspergillus nomiae NRRL 13137]KNG90660.1 acetyltransferase, GNAT family [Aspergillus nomiae NRRL 13137]